MLIMRQKQLYEGSRWSSAQSEPCVGYNLRRNEPGLCAYYQCHRYERHECDRYEISAKGTLAIRKRRPRNVKLRICYVPSTSQTSQIDVFGTSMGLHCAI
jgi:hypothetical protein